MARAKDEFVVEGLKRLRDEEELSDFTLAADGGEWKVHKAVLCIHSPILYKMATSQFMESQTGRAELKDVGAHVVGAMVQYFYSLDYDYPEGLTRWPQISFDAGLAKVVDMYDVKNLIKMAGERIFAALTNTGEDLKLDLLCMAWDHEGIPEEIRDGIAKIAGEKIEVFGTPKGLEALTERPELAVQVAVVQATQKAKSKAYWAEERRKAFGSDSE